MRRSILDRREAAVFRLGALLIALGSSSAPGLAAAQADEDACRPDVFRLCASAIPDETAIVTCLNANASGLSPACRQVIDPVEPAPPLSRGSTGTRSRRQPVRS